MNARYMRIDKEHLKEKIADYMDAYFYMCGSPPFINAMIEDLQELGISKEQIKREQWG